MLEEKNKKKELGGEERRGRGQARGIEEEMGCNGKEGETEIKGRKRKKKINNCLSFTRGRYEDRRLGPILWLISCVTKLSLSVLSSAEWDQPHPPYRLHRG